MPLTLRTHEVLCSVRETLRAIDEAIQLGEAHANSTAPGVSIPEFRYAALLCDVARIGIEAAFATTGPQG